MFLWIVALAGCGPGTLQDSTYWYGGTVSIAVSPVGDGLTATAEVPGAAALENLSACQSYMLRQVPRANDGTTNHVASVCAPIDITGNSCFSQAEVTVSTWADGESVLFVDNANGCQVESDSITVDIDVSDLSMDPTGFARGTATIDEGCYGPGPLEHQVEVHWAFTESEDLVEGRPGEIEPWVTAMPARR
jgi:hypothetical protein